jgi:methionyl-tRNA formyltransferase
VNWAIINGENETGNTMMLLDEGVDTGDILAQRRFPIETTTRAPRSTSRSLGARTR